jgi:hypothetical protein
VVSQGSSYVIVLNQIKRQRFARVTLDPRRVAFCVGSARDVFPPRSTSRARPGTGAPVAASTT